MASTLCFRKTVLKNFSVLLVFIVILWSYDVVSPTTGAISFRRSCNINSTLLVERLFVASVNLLQSRIEETSQIF